MNTGPVVIRAQDYADPSLPQTAWGEAVVAAAAGPLRNGKDVVVSFEGVRGVASTYFNVVVLGLLESVSPDELERRVRFETDLKALRWLLEGSLRAALASRRRAG